ncbi:MAG: phosphatidylserine/phosphatidylglycerophosphate/cardiolipin synthase family protein [Mycoplasmataceae bacterium]|nr:phosphatidylserine/phosphatidylglycerophosphate/cardiolipin synthase family protein [Mycoplasmataceae bacterium]
MIKHKPTRAAIGVGLLLLVIFPIILIPILLLAYGYFLISLVVILIYYIFNFWALIHAYLNERTDVQAKVTWTFLEFMFPGVGFYVYFIFARSPKKIIKKLKKSELLENEILEKNISNSKFELLMNGEEKFPVLFKELEKAKKYINIQYFIFNQGILQSKLFSILRIKKEEGVKIRILFDHLGNLRLTNKIINGLRKEGFEIVDFRPIKWFSPSGADNWRTHNKFVTIDGNIVLFGGINFGDEYAGLTGKYGEWIDTHYKASGNVVKAFESIFSIQWHIATQDDISKEFLNNKSKTKNLNIYLEKKVEILYDSPERPIPLTFNRIKEKIDLSKKNIRIISPYIVFPISFKNKIRNAINRGVKIEMITTGLKDKKSAYYQGTFDIETLTELGVKVYRTNNIFIHTKMFLFDEDKAIFGTTNLDYRALFHHFETNIQMCSNEVLNLVKYFEKIKNNSILTITKRSDWWFGRSIIYFILRFFKGLF